jgi:dihydroorotate dehydrogenase electron transfer subunit
MRPPAEPPFLLARPFGVHRVGEGGWVEILLKVVGRGTRLLAQARPGTELDVLGPIGNGFDLSRPPRTAVLVAGGTGIAPLYLLAERLHREGSDLVVLIGTGRAVPMTVSDSEQAVHFLDESVTAVIDEYVALGALMRIATIEPRPGCYTGTSVDLLRQYLGCLGPDESSDKEIFSCGPWAMQAAVARLAEHHGIPCQVLLEERMGCGLGACMACVCKIRDESGQYKNRRVCVDGPVFRAQEVGWEKRE